MTDIAGERLIRIKQLGFYVTRSGDDFQLVSYGGGRRAPTAQEVALWYALFQRYYMYEELEIIGFTS